MPKNPLQQLLDHGQSFWMDTISRDMILGGELKRFIKQDNLRGVTSNPDIFQKAISGSTLYDDQITKLAKQGKSTGEIYEALAVEDIRKAADVLKPVYESSDGVDGYISLEVSPYLAFDEQGTVEEGHRLWAAVGKPNVMIKVPATRPCIAAIEQLIADGININVTLIFSLESYDNVMEAYLRGLERRAKAGESLKVASVASFFLSRIDVLVDKLLGNRVVLKPKQGSVLPQSLMGKAAVASAKVAYANFQKKFGDARFAELAKKGARVQRPLWASTGTKNPLYHDTKYVEPLIAPDTVNTMPMPTIDAWRDHGVARANTISEGLDEARQVIEQLRTMGIDLVNATWQIQEEGVTKFTQPFDKLLTALADKRAAVLGWKDAQTEALGKLEKPAKEAASAMSEAQFVLRLFTKDTSLWTDDAEVADKISNRLGWLDSPKEFLQKVPELTQFAKEVRASGIKHVVLLGMGGSSLCPEVAARTFGSAKGYPELIVLDSTSPDAVASVERRIDLAKTLFIPASKSGSTVETNSFFAHFWRRLQEAGAANPGEHFVAITDPGSPAIDLAKKHNFRRIFENPADIGGRYSALSYFGLVPMALIGVDVKKLLQRAVAFMADGHSIVPAWSNPAVRLGTILGMGAKGGRDKLTLLLSPQIESLAYWIEQLVAESTGKEGKGIVPVEGEKLGVPTNGSSDRLFVSISLRGEKADQKLTLLEKSGAPVVRIVLNDVYDLGAEFVRWEIATAVAGALLGINPFDEPNVTESKDNTKALLKEHRERGSLPLPNGNIKMGAASVALSSAAQKVAKKTNTGSDAITGLLSAAGARDYIAILVFVEQSAVNAKALGIVRERIAKATGRATTLGFGPRYLHSTGQLHKGGANNGIYIVITTEPREDIDIPGQPYTFGTLALAQGLGDFRSLNEHDRRAVHIHVGPDITATLKQLAQAIPAK